jgi:hypothetical protein
MNPYQPDIFNKISEISTDDDIIDIILSELNKSQNQCDLFERDNRFMDEQRIYRIVNMLKYHNLAEIFGTPFRHKIPLRITQNGTFICNKGGWLVYNSEIKQKEEQDNKLRLQEVEATLSSSKYQKMSMYVSAAAFIVSSYFAYLQHSESSKQQTELDTLRVKVKSLDSLLIFQGKVLEEKKSPPNSLYRKKYLKAKL